MAAKPAKCTQKAAFDRGSRVLPGHRGHGGTQWHPHTPTRIDGPAAVPAANSAS